MSTTEISAFVAAGSTILGGIVLKFVEWVLTRGKQKEEKAAAQRQELRQEAMDLRDQLDKARSRLDSSEQEIDRWKNRYYGILDQLLTMKAQGLNVPKLEDKDLIPEEN